MRRDRPPTRPRVCILRQSDVYERMVQREAEALFGAGCDVEVILMQGDDRPSRTVVNGVAVISLPASRRRGASKARYAFDYGHFFVLAAGFLAARHAHRPYDVIQAYSMPDFLVFAALVPKLLGSRVIAYMGEPTPELAETLYGAGWLTRVLALLEQWSLRFADHSITVTDQLKQRYVERGATADRITVVLNGADPETMFANWSPAPELGKSGFTAICHGTIEDRYGQDTIIEAARLLRGEMPDLRIVITGRGSLSRKITRLVAENGVPDVVQFEGWVSRSRLNDLLHSADAGIVAQKASPYSHLVHTNKMVDYWMFGLPVIASRLRATAETYDDHVIEYFEPGDPADLAAAIRRLRFDPGRRSELTANGKLALLTNGWAAQREAYLGVFAALLNRAGHPAEDHMQIPGLTINGVPLRPATARQPVRRRSDQPNQLP